MTKLQAQIAQFEKALRRLGEVLAAEKNDITRDSAIQRFEFTLDLSWKSLKTYLEDKKGIVVASPKECFKEAYRQGIIAYQEGWITMVDMGNATVHTYDEEAAEEIFCQLPDAVKRFEELLKVLLRP